MAATGDGAGAGAGAGASAGTVRAGKVSFLNSGTADPMKYYKYFETLPNGEAELYATGVYTNAAMPVVMTPHGFVDATIDPAIHGAPTIYPYVIEGGYLMAQIPFPIPLADGTVVAEERLCPVTASTPKGHLYMKILLLSRALGRAIATSVGATPGDMARIDLMKAMMIRLIADAERMDGEAGATGTAETAGAVDGDDDLSDPSAALGALTLEEYGKDGGEDAAAGAAQSATDTDAADGEDPDYDNIALYDTAHDARGALIEFTYDGADLQWQAFKMYDSPWQIDGEMQWAMYWNPARPW